jgi:hypothetical protein
VRLQSRRAPRLLDTVHVRYSRMSSIPPKRRKRCRPAAHRPQRTAGGAPLGRDPLARKQARADDETGGVGESWVDGIHW